MPNLRAAKLAIINRIRIALRHGSLIGGMACALALAVGCGVKSAPIAPELVRPAQITDLRAVADPNGIKLLWERPTHYSGGRTMRDLGGFVIMRAEASGPLTALVELPVTDRERFAPQHQFSYIDNETTLGHDYRYQIIAKTTDGYVSVPSNEAAFTRIVDVRADDVGRRQRLDHDAELVPVVPRPPGPFLHGLSRAGREQAPALAVVVDGHQRVDVPRLRRPAMKRKRRNRSAPSRYSKIRSRCSLPSSFCS
jgi:hypothetical protein